VTRRSGSSICGEHVSHGSKRLKRAMFPSAFASLRSDPVSWARYQRKRDRDKAPWARPSSPWPTAARHTIQGSKEPWHLSMRRSSTWTIRLADPSVTKYCHY